MKAIQTALGTCFAIGKVGRVLDNPSIHWDVEVTLPNGKGCMFAITTLMGHAVGDHVLVRFLPDDQFAEIISVAQVAAQFGYKL